MAFKILLTMSWHCYLKFCGKAANNFFSCNNHNKYWCWLEPTNRSAIVFTLNLSQWNSQAPRKSFLVQQLLVRQRAVSSANKQTLQWCLELIYLRVHWPQFLCPCLLSFFSCWLLCSIVQSCCFICLSLCLLVCLNVLTFQCLCAHCLHACYFHLKVSPEKKPYYNNNNNNKNNPPNPKKPNFSLAITFSVLWHITVPLFSLAAHPSDTILINFEEGYIGKGFFLFINEIMGVRLRA